MKRKLALGLSAMFLLVFVATAQDKFCKVWYTQEGSSKVQIFLAADGKYYGKIVWLRDGIVNGKPLIDKKNPDETRRYKPWLGLQIISGLEKKSETEIVSGKIYDPSHGNYYSCKMTFKEPNKLELRGYIMGLPFLGKTTTWYLAEDNKPATVQKPQPPATDSGSKKDL